MNKLVALNEGHRDSGLNIVGKLPFGVQSTPGQGSKFFFSLPLKNGVAKDEK